MTKVTVAPITTTIKGLSSEVPVGPGNGLDDDCVISLDNVITVAVGCSAAPSGTSTPNRRPTCRAPWSWPTTWTYPCSHDPGGRLGGRGWWWSIQSAKRLVTLPASSVTTH